MAVGEGDSVSLGTGVGECVEVIAGVTVSLSVAVKGGGDAWVGGHWVRVGVAWLAGVALGNTVLVGDFFLGVVGVKLGVTVEVGLSVAGTTVGGGGVLVVLGVEVVGVSEAGKVVLVGIIAGIGP